MLEKTLKEFKNVDEWRQQYRFGELCLPEISFGYYDDKKLVGICLCSKAYFKPSEIVIDILAVDPAYQRRRIGHTLIDRVLYKLYWDAWFKKEIGRVRIHYGVFADNEASNALAESMGFKVRGVDVICELLLPTK